MAYRLSQLAEMVGGTVRGHPDRQIEAIRPLETAGPRDLSFLTNPRYRRQAGASRAGALLVAPGWLEVEADLLLVADPYLALARLLEVFHPPAELRPGVHPSAIVEEGSEVDPSAAVGAYSVVGAGSRIEAHAHLHPHVVVGQDCRIGSGTILYPHVVLYDRTEVGKGCILHSGVVLGCDGFGYGRHQGVHVKLPHVGRVVVEDEVEIGANSAVDRALLEETRLGEGSKIDNLVQVAHNVRIGRGCLLISQTAIAGSTRLGDGVVLAGQSGVAGHLELGDEVQVAAKTAVFKSVAAGEKVAGIPATRAARWWRQQALVGRLAELSRRLKRLEKKLGAVGKETGGDE